jgi:four helix bundle protein
MTKSFKDLIVWQKAKEVAIEIYITMSKFPASEMYGLSSQMRRSAISISSNIAESYHRKHKKEKDQFLSIAYGSSSELESQIDIAEEIYPQIKFTKAVVLLLEVQKILNSFLHH